MAKKTKKNVTNISNKKSISVESIKAPTEKAPKIKGAIPIEQFKTAEPIVIKPLEEVAEDVSIKTVRAEKPLENVEIVEIGNNAPTKAKVYRCGKCKSTKVIQIRTGFMCQDCNSTVASQSFQNNAGQSS